MGAEGRADRRLEREIDVLSHMRGKAGSLRQRDVAGIVGLSLGMTNAILKRLATKGWIAVRKVNNRNIRYAVTAKGIEQISRRSYRYLKQTVRNVVMYRAAVMSLVREVRAQGYDEIVLIGQSELDFIVEHACRICGLRFHADEKKTGRRAFRLYSERRYHRGAGGDLGAGRSYLHAVLTS